MASQNVQAWYNNYIRAFAFTASSSLGNLNSKIYLASLQSFIDKHNVKFAFIYYNSFVKETTGKGALARKNCDFGTIYNPSKAYDHFNGDIDYMNNHLDEYWQCVLDNLFEEIDAYHFKNIHESYSNLPKSIIDYVVKCACYRYKQKYHYETRGRQDCLTKLIKCYVERIQAVFDKFASCHSFIKLNIYDYFTYDEIHQKVMSNHSIEYSVKKYCECLQKFLGSFEFSDLHPNLMYLMMKVFKWIPNATKEQFDIIRQFEDSKLYERTTVYDEKYNKQIQLYHEKYTHKKIGNTIYVDWNTMTQSYECENVKFLIWRDRVYIKWNFDDYFITYLENERYSCIHESDEDDSIYVSYDAYLFYSSMLSYRDFDGEYYAPPHYEYMIQIAKDILAKMNNKK